MDSERITKFEKIACLKRELALRRNVYRQRVARGAMKQEDADRELAVMTAILSDYEPTEAA